MMQRVAWLLVLAAFAVPVAAFADSGPGGDIPDNQVFLVFHDRSGGYTIKYPEGWARRGNGALVTFTDKDNTIRIAVSMGKLPSAAAVRSQLHGAKITGGPTRLTLPGGPGLKMTYQRQSAPNPVTGKRVTLMIDRYYVAGHGHLAVLDLGTPVGVDNVDAYRLISRSFRWR
jgi:hypothetical protein